MKNKEKIKDKTNDNPSKKNTKDEEKKSHKFLRKIITTFILIILVFLIFFGIIASTKIHTFLKLSKEMIKNESSDILDSDGNTIAKIGCERVRENVSFDQIPDNLKNAYVSIEDQRFYKHHGVDIKRTCGAILTYIKNLGSANFGGSTITQQLVKNLTSDDSASASRKIKEWVYAIALESSLSKDEILGAYLNIIYVGPNIYGVQSGAKYYFNKDVSNLSLAECAFLAGINNAPNSYNPFSENDRSAKIVKRTKTVLNKMLELNFIDSDEFDSAILEVDNGLKFSKGASSSGESTVYSYHTDSLLNEVTQDFAKKNFITEDFATNYFALSNSTIYSTQNSSIQDIMTDEFSKKKYIIQSSKNPSSTSQAAMV